MTERVPDPTQSEPVRVCAYNDARELLGYVVSDANFPRKMVNVRDREERWVLGSPFAVMSVPDLRAWAAAFTEAADRLEQP